MITKKNKGKEILFILFIFFLITYNYVESKDIRIVSNSILSSSVNSSTTINNGNGAGNRTSLISSDNSINIYAPSPLDNTTLNITVSSNYLTSSGLNMSYLTINQNNSLVHRNSTNTIYDANISCSNIVSGSDTDFCTDATGSGGVFTNSLSNLTALISTDNRIIITADSNPRNNQTINLTLASSVTQFLYNFTLADLFNYNFTLSDLFNYNFTLASQNMNIFNESKGVGTINSSNIINISCSQISATLGDTDFCTDATSTGGVFSNAVSNLTALINNDTNIYINITGNSNGANNQSLIIGLTTNATRWFQNSSNYSSLEIHGGYNNLLINQTFQIITAFAQFWNNQTASIMTAYQSQWYNHTSIIISQVQTYTAIPTYNVNLTINGGNISYIGINSGTTFNAANRIFDNGSCLRILGRTAQINIC